MQSAEFPKYPTIRDLGGHIVDLIRYPDEKDPKWSAFNPSIGFNGKSVYATMIRSSNYVINSDGEYKTTIYNEFKNRTYYSELNNDLTLKKLRLVDYDGLNIAFRRGPEDGKLFYRDGWHFTCVVMEKDIYGPAARMGVAKLNTRTNKVEDFKVLPGQSPERPEKNWMIPYEPSPNFDWVYGANRVLVGGTLNTWMVEKPEVDKLRGSSNLIRDPENEDGYLGLMHRTFFSEVNPIVGTTFGSKRIQIRNYVHYFVRFDKHGYIDAVSDGFQFYKPGVEFGAGMVIRGKDILVSFGRNDVSSHIAVLPLDTVLKSLIPVEY